MDNDVKSVLPGHVILVVDDDPINRTLCATVLQKDGYLVLTAEGSADALEICDNYVGRVDLILLDVLLYPSDVQLQGKNNGRPNVHADQLIPMLRSKRPLSRILLMSANSRWRLAGRGMAEHLRQYDLLEKPITADRLVATVRALLEKPLPGRTLH
jgi:DNA-binding NtrC family response regulator